VIQGLNFDIGGARVLKGLNAMLQHSELVAIMGESGSGKTTLLNVLGGRAGYGWISGDQPADDYPMLLNGRPYYPTAFQHMLGYVPQAHLIFKELTVYENLLYAAQLRLLRNVDTEQREHLVDLAISLLGLQECRHFVCDPAIGERLSGGQLRRVGIGIELVCDPPIMLLDEPTSALDAVNTRLVAAALRDLARRGVLVVASLHQPRHAVYEMLDRLVLLRKGEVIYGGMRDDAVRYFGELGYRLPPQSNPADFFIEIAFSLERTYPPNKKTHKWIEGIVGHAEVELGWALLKTPDPHPGPSGQSWERCDGGRPMNGSGHPHILKNVQLSHALEKRTGGGAMRWAEFTAAEWAAFGVAKLRYEHIVESSGSYFKPCEGPLEFKKYGDLPHCFGLTRYWNECEKNAPGYPWPHDVQNGVFLLAKDRDIRYEQDSKVDPRLEFAETLGALWRHWFRTSLQTSQRLMGIWNRKHSERRRLATAVLRYARSCKKKARKKSMAENGVAARTFMKRASSIIHGASLLVSGGHANLPGSRCRGGCLTPSDASTHDSISSSSKVNRRECWNSGWVLNNISEQKPPWTADDASHAPMRIKQVGIALNLSKDRRVSGDGAHPLHDPLPVSNLNKHFDNAARNTPARASTSRATVETELVMQEAWPKPSCKADSAASCDSSASMSSLRASADAGNLLTRTCGDATLHPSVETHHCGVGCRQMRMTCNRTLDPATTDTSLDLRCSPSIVVSSPRLSRWRWSSFADSPYGYHERDQVGVSRGLFVEWFESALGFAGTLDPDLGKQVWSAAVEIAQQAFLDAGQERQFQMRIGTFSTRERNLPQSRVQPTWVHLRTAMANWQTGWSTRYSDEEPGFVAQFVTCTKRYAYKNVRTRMRIYMLLFVTAGLGALCGALHGDDPDPSVVMTFFLLYNSMFGSICATSMIGTFGGGPETVDFFRHEAFSGVSQVAEGLARLMVDIVQLSLLAPVFAWSLQAFGALHFDLIVPLMTFAWALSPLGYIFTLVAPSNTTVLTTSATFVICAFLNGFFGVRISKVPHNVQWLLQLSPGHSAFRLMSLGAVLSEPFSTKRWSLIRQLWYTRMIPESRGDVLAYELQQVPWRAEALWTLAVVGFVLRVFTIILFHIRSNVVMAGAWDRARLRAWDRVSTGCGE
jgi:ABC-type multidrug transport system ATPase subunit